MALSNVNDAALLEIDDPFTKELVEIWSCLNFKKNSPLIFLICQSGITLLCELTTSLFTIK